MYLYFILIFVAQSKVVPLQNLQLPEDMVKYNLGQGLFLWMEGGGGGE